MKTLTSGLVFICAVAGLCVPAVAQITITAGDAAARLTIGNTIINNDDTLTTTANIGAPGGQNTWDFSGLFAHNITTLKSVALSSTPFSNNFPGVTHALKTSLAGSIPGIPYPVSGDLYLFVTAGTNLLNPGNMGGGTVTVTGLGAVPGQLAITNVPPDTTYGLPSTLGTRWGSTYTSTTVVTIGSGIELLRTAKSYALTYLVDAWGTMKMPGGGTYDALRVRKENRAGGLSVGYIFLAKNGASVQFTLSDASQPNSGMISVSQKTVSWSPPFIAPTGVEVAGGAPVSFALLQNYPNPFNPSTMIRFQIAATSHVTLKVFDILGREVARLVDENREQGIYSVRFDAARLAGGVYYYTLNAGSYTQTRSMMLVK